MYECISITVTNIYDGQKTIYGNGEYMITETPRPAVSDAEDFDFWLEKRVAELREDPVFAELGRNFQLRFAVEVFGFAVDWALERRRR